MSKYLVKILSICALVVMLAVSVVGAAVCVTEAIGVTLSVATACEKSEYEGATSDVAIFIDEKEQEEDKIQLTKYTEVTVRYTGSVGYIFDGWFDSNNKKVSEKENYTFEVKRNTRLSAKAHLRPYTVNYTGLLDDDSSSVGDQIAETEEVKYGTELRVISSSDRIFGGWYRETIGEDNEVVKDGPYRYADFGAAETVTLSPAWSDTLKVNVAFKQGSDDVSVMTYDHATKTFSGFNKTRGGYTLVGINFNDTVYNYDKTNNTFTNLAAAIIATGQNEVDAYAVWLCDYSSVTFSFDAMYVGADDTLMNAKDATGAWVEVNEVLATFTDAIGEDNYDLAANAYDLFISKFAGIQDQEGNALTYANKIKVNVSGTSITETLNDATAPTFQQILGLMSEAGHDTAALTVHFIFA